MEDEKSPVSGSVESQKSERKAVCTQSEANRGILCKKIEAKSSLLETIKSTVAVIFDEGSWKKISKLMETQNIEGVLEVLNDKNIGKATKELHKLIRDNPDYVQFILDKILDTVQANLKAKYEKAGDSKSQKKLKYLGINAPKIREFLKNNNRGAELLDLMSDQEFLISILEVGKDFKDYNSKQYRGLWGRRGKADAMKIAGKVVNLDLKKAEPLLAKFVAFYLRHPEALKKNIQPINMGRGRLGVKRKQRLEEQIRAVFPLLPKILGNKENLQRHKKEIGKIIYYMKRLGDPRTSKVRKLWSIARLTMALEHIDPRLRRKIVKREFPFGVRSVSARRDWKLWLENIRLRWRILREKRRKRRRGF